MESALLHPPFASHHVLLSTFVTFCLTALALPHRHSLTSRCLFSAPLTFSCPSGVLLITSDGSQAIRSFLFSTVSSSPSAQLSQQHQVLNFCLGPFSFPLCPPFRQLQPGPNLAAAPLVFIFSLLSLTIYHTTLRRKARSCGPA